MVLKTKASKSTKSANTGSTSSTDTSSTKSTGSKSTGSKSIFDRDGDNDIDLDDLLIGLRECVTWVISWRGAMLFGGAFGLFAASLNITAWVGAMAPLGMGAPIAGVVTWGLIQWRELAPILDDLNLKSSIAAMVRLQRKPMDIPLLNENLHGHAKARYRRYRNREKNAELGSEFVRWVCYGLEFAVLVVGGGILTPVGVSWSGVLLALVGMVGVEMGLRMFNTCGEKLMTPEEREYLRSIEKSVQRTTVSAASLD
jgi:hypothetical protein